MASKRKQTLQVVHPNCAGVDIGKKSHYVAVHESADTHSVRAFGCFTDELEDMAAWLESCAVDVVAMEATGVYWIPVYEVLDRAGFEVHLVDARATKQVSGRKSDVRDCQWIRELMSYGLLRGAFRPRDEDCVVRSYVRQRGRLVRERARCVQHMQKALTQMNVQLDTVLNDVMGKSGEAIVRSIVGGERDATVLARMCDRRVKADMATIARALRGNWRAEHVFALSQALERHDFYADQIRAVEEQIVETLKDRGLDEEIAEAMAAGAYAPEARARPATDGARGHGRRLGGDSDDWGRDCVDGPCGAWWRSVALCDERAVLLVAELGAGDANQRGKGVEGASDEAGQPGGAGVAHGGKHRPSQPELHWCMPSRSTSTARRGAGGEGDRASARAIDLRHAHARRGVCREGHGWIRDGTTRTPASSSAASGQTLQSHPRADGASSVRSLRYEP